MGRFAMPQALAGVNRLRGGLFWGLGGLEAAGDAGPAYGFQDGFDVGGFVAAEVVEVGVAREVDGEDGDGVPDGDAAAGAALVVEKVVVVEVKGGPGPAGGVDRGLLQIDKVLGDAVKAGGDIFGEGAAWAHHRRCPGCRKRARGF